MRKKWLKKVFVLAMAAALITPAVPSPVMTAEAAIGDVVTEKDLKNKPPKDYKVNMDMQREAAEGEHGKFFLKDDIQTVKLEVDETNLQYLFDYAADKPSVLAKSVTIGEETVQYVGLKTKGNYTLAHTASRYFTSQRYSLTVNFGKYIKKDQYGVKQNFYGCNKISFNNFFFDKSMMREYMSWTLLSEMGLPTPEFGLAKLYINGDYHGVYFMVEALDEAILERYKQVADNQISNYLMKPEKTDMQYDFALDKLINKDGVYDLSSVLKMDKKGQYKVSGKLKDSAYLWEDDEESLQDVAEMMPTVLTWQKKMTLLSSGKDFSGNEIDVNSKEYLELLEQLMDVDEAVRYFATHSFLVQLDDMFNDRQNFGLYIGEDGRSLFVPWDYDLSFGCYHPSTAELTANFPLEQMHKSEWLRKEELRGDYEEFTYADYPLFHVIYQNKELMNKYYSYMKDCAKVMIFGGTTSLGKTYEPNYAYGVIKGIYDELKEAASEPLAEDVYYVNHTVQPNDMIRANPNLSKIIAMRAVGVYAQVMKMDSIVCGEGCDLSTLGNAVWGENSNRGKLMIVDDATGIFVTAEYGGGLKAKAPKLTVKKIGEEERTFRSIKKKIGCENAADMTVYCLSSSAKATSGYTVNVPMGTEAIKGNAALYSYSGGKATKLDPKVDDSIYTAELEHMDYIVIVKGGAAKGNGVPLAVWIVFGVVAVVVIGIIVIFGGKKKKIKKREQLKNKV